ncbi:MAG: tetratricopeptide repeat protein [Pseudomonadales bacterium]
MTVTHGLGVTMAAACIGLAILSGCAAMHTSNPRALDKRAELLSGEIIFGEVVDVSAVPEVNILETSDAMHAFLEEEVGHTTIAATKFRRLLGGLADHGYFAASYAANATRTAAETFRWKSGNCLSYTSMFIAMARGVGLDARYQVVSVPPSWDADAGYLIRYTHVNVLMRRMGNGRALPREFAVDFNDVLPDPDYPRHMISDREATALFYANRSISLLRAGNMRDSFVYLKKAIAMDSDNADLWINLGAFYAKQEHYQDALAAYQVALHHDPHHRSALAGIGRAYEMLGNHEEAEKYAQEVRRYRERNPYYHYALAQAAFEDAEYEDALDAINTAIDLKYRNGRFHFLKGLTQYKLGDLEAAQESFQRAARFGNYRDLKQRYVSDFAATAPLG